MGKRWDNVTLPIGGVGGGGSSAVKYHYRTAPPPPHPPRLEGAELEGDL